MTISTELQVEVLGYLRSCDRMRAIVAIRRSANIGLAEAVEILKTLEANLMPAELSAEDHMGMSANIIAVGSFSREIVGHLEYRAEVYSDTQDGAPITQILFQVNEGSSRSRQLAACFAIDPWDFNQHRIVPENANLRGLREMFSDEEVETFQALTRAGFQFYFRPNG